METSGSLRMLICIDRTVQCQIPKDCDILHIHLCSSSSSSSSGAELPLIAESFGLLSDLFIESL
jgi:hypothetical protein